KAIQLAKQAKVDLSARISKEDQVKIEETYQHIRHHYVGTTCDDCGAQGPLVSWTKTDMVTMAREAGMEKAVLGLYFLPTLQIHTTPTRMVTRLEETSEGIAFISGPQRKAADAALVGAHMCLALTLEEQERHFNLGLNIEEIRRGFQHAWPVTAKKEDAQADE